MLTAVSEEHEGKQEPLASFAAARRPSTTAAPPETKLLVPLRRLLVAVLMKAAGRTLRVDDEKARTDRLMLALTSNAYHTVAEQGVMLPGLGVPSAKRQPISIGSYNTNILCGRQTECVCGTV